MLKESILLEARSKVMPTSEGISPILVQIVQMWENLSAKWPGYRTETAILSLHRSFGWRPCRRIFVETVNWQMR